MRASYENTLKNVASITGSGAQGDASFVSISTDSRDCDASTLFVPLSGEKFDGHDFIAPLCGEGRIAAYLTHKGACGGNVPRVECSDTLAALASLARDYRRGFSMPLLGITGTNGKTTTKELICAALSPRYLCHKSEKNYNNEIGVPFALFGLRPGHTYAVIEMGMNHPGEIERIAAMALPDIAVITNAAEGHLEFLGSVEGVANAKSEIFTAMREGSRVFINRDTETWPILEARARARNLVVTSYGLDARADITPEKYELFEESLSITVKGITYTAPLYGLHNVANLLCAVTVGLYAGADVHDMRRSLAAFSNVGGRSELVKGRVTVIRDTYNSNPLSLASAILSAKAVFPARRKIAVLADMKELGEGSAAYHFAAGRQLFDAGFSTLMVYGNDAAEIARGAICAGLSTDCVGIFDSKEKLVASLRGALNDDDVVLVKGSRSMKMEEVADAILR